MEWWNAVLPVVTLVLGYVGTLWTESRRDTRASVEASRVRELERRTRLGDERRTFELETLRSAADAIGKLARATGKAHHFDVSAAKRDGTDRYLNYLMPEELNDELFQCNRAVVRVGAELMDDETRRLVDQVRAGLSALGVSNGMTVADAEKELTRLAGLVDEAQQAIASRLRAIYDGSLDLRPPAST